MEQEFNITCPQKIWFMSHQNHKCIPTKLHIPSKLHVPKQLQSEVLSNDEIKNFKNCLYIYINVQ
jgi:hypothetical protein